MFMEWRVPRNTPNVQRYQSSSICSPWIASETQLSEVTSRSQSSPPSRILTQRGFLQAIGRSGQPTSGKGSSVEKMAPFLDLENLKPYIDKDLEQSSRPILFRGPSAPKGAYAFGYRAELLPRVCEVYLRARDDSKLSKVQVVSQFD